MRLSRPVPLLAAALVLFAAAFPSKAASGSRAIALEVDAREAPRKIFHARLTIPASPGPLTLVYPKWIPGEHGPTGPITDLAGLKLSAGGKPISWRRDDAELWFLHCTVPAGADSVEVALDYLSPGESRGFSSGASATAQLALLSWNQVLLYPKTASTDELTYAASLVLPAGWKFGTALEVSRKEADRIDFQPVSLTTLVDSPVLAGAHMRTIALTDTEPKHRLQIAADSEAALDMRPEHIAQIQALVAETGALYGARHYRHYDFLLTLSNHTAHFGLEHHESSDNRVPERALIDADVRKSALAGLLGHEITHSWNGKFRRPAGLATGNFHDPMKGELLWVYEGLTTYLGQILTARDGELSPEQYREALARTAATMDHQAGRSWRPLSDTAIAAQRLYEARADWSAWRRGVDFYPESELLWLEADTLIRIQTKGKRSLDDFCRAFLGGASGPVRVATYTFDDVVAQLNRVAPYDWRGFWGKRLETTDPSAPLSGLAASGWKLVYTDQLPDTQRASEETTHTTDVRFSIGITLRQDGVIPDVIPNLPAARAGIGPGMRLVAVNGRRSTRDILREALRAARDPGKPIELLVESGEFYRSYRLDYTGGERYPALERDPARPDLLSQIIAARAGAAPAK
ncbi:MAG: M61 family metallopeptidase [Thermoanaerobaculia bacterium]